MRYFSNKLKLQYDIIDNGFLFEDNVFYLACETNVLKNLDVDTLRAIYLVKKHLGATIRNVS